MPHLIKVVTDQGQRHATAHWSNGALAVTQHFGSYNPVSGLLIEDNEDMTFTLTHQPTGWAMTGLVYRRTDPDEVQALAEHLAPLFPWESFTVETLQSDRKTRAAIVVTAHTWWTDRGVAKPVESRAKAEG